MRPDFLHHVGDDSEAGQASGKWAGDAVGDGPVKGCDPSRPKAN
jgi:hypothetical protein